MSSAAPALTTYSLELETGDAGNARLLGGEVPLVFSPRLLALASKAELEFIRLDEHLECSPLKECVSFFQKRCETFALAALCGSDLSFLHFVAPESPWPRGEKAVKENVRKYRRLVDKYHDPAWAERVRLDRSLLSMMHADVTREPEHSADDTPYLEECLSLDASGYPLVPYRDVPLKGALPVEDIPAYVKDLLSFCTREDYLPQMQSSLAHLQFHYASPFSTMNAPVGTLLAYLVYARRHFSRNIFVSVAEATLTRVDNPVDEHKAVGEGAMNPYGLWVYHASKSTLRQIERTRKVEERFARIRERWLELLSARRCSPICLQLATDLLAYPFVDSALIQRRYGRTAPAANGIIQTLVGRGILQPVNDNKRYRLFYAKDVVDIYYDAFGVTLPKGWLSSDAKKLDFE